MPEEKKDMLGNLDLIIDGKLDLLVDVDFTIDVDRLRLLEKKLLNFLGVFVGSATGVGGLLNGKLSLTVLGKKIMKKKQMFSIPSDDADILVKGLLQVLDEFVTEA